MLENEIFQPDQLQPEGKDPEIVELEAVPYDDHRRVAVRFRLTPFSQPPSAALKVLDDQQHEVSSADLVNILHLESEITIHLPADGNQPGRYQVELKLFRIEDETEAEDGQSPEINQIDLDHKNCSFLLQ